MADRRCRFCARVFRAKNPKALYCSDSHRSMAYQRRAAQVAGRADFAELQARLTREAPAGSHAYRLSAYRNGTGALMSFPRKGLGFLLDPFEPPRVLEGLYAVEFFDEAGRSLGTPAGLLSGVYVEAFGRRGRSTTS